jgi:ABC-type microcin C transport system permease subunit YejE
MKNVVNRAFMAKKKVLVSLVLFVALLTGTFYADAAHNNDNFTVRFRENTLVVTSTQMEEARIYSMQGKLLQKEKGNFAEFELDRGTYRLYAKVNGNTLSRRIELR